MKLNKEVTNSCKCFSPLFDSASFFFLTFMFICVYVFFEIFEIFWLCVFSSVQFSLVQFSSFLSLFFFCFNFFEFWVLFRDFLGDFFCEVLFACRTSFCPRGKSMKGCWFFLLILRVSAELLPAKMVLSLFYFPL